MSEQVINYLTPEIYVRFPEGFMGRIGIGVLIAVGLIGLSLLIFAIGEKINAKDLTLTRILGRIPFIGAILVLICIVISFIMCGPFGPSRKISPVEVVQCYTKENQVTVPITDKECDKLVALAQSSEQLPKNLENYVEIDGVKYIALENSTKVNISDSKEHTMKVTEYKLNENDIPNSLKDVNFIKEAYIVDEIN